MPGLPWRRFAVVALCFCLVAAGCQTVPKTTYSTERPATHTITSEHAVIHSDVKLEPHDPIISELDSVRTQVFDVLQLPKQRDPVDVFLFSDEASYRFYMHTTWRDLPPRRAYFVGTSRELAVYSFAGPQVREDLRHEFTHGLLHSTLQTVPLWLDEGLAEYFEVPAETPGAAHAGHLHELRLAAQENWSPNLYRLEMISDFRDLTARDYAECWAWVHFLLNSSPEASEVLMSYLKDLQSARVAKPMLKSLEEAEPAYARNLTQHVASLQNLQLAARP